MYRFALALLSPLCYAQTRSYAGTCTDFRCAHAQQRRYAGTHPGTAVTAHAQRYVGTHHTAVSVTERDDHIALRFTGPRGHLTIIGTAPGQLDRILCSRPSLQFTVRP